MAETPLPAETQSRIDAQRRTVTLLQSSVVQVWDRVLGTQKHVAGAEMTIADISLYAGWVRIKGASPGLCEGLSNLERWAKEMAARPAMQRATKF